MHHVILIHTVIPAKDVSGVLQSGAAIGVSNDIILGVHELPKVTKKCPIVKNMLLNYLHATTVFGQAAHLKKARHECLRYSASVHVVLHTAIKMIKTLDSEI